MREGPIGTSWQLRAHAVTRRLACGGVRGRDGGFGELDARRLRTSSRVVDPSRIGELVGVG